MIVAIVLFLIFVGLALISTDMLVFFMPNMTWDMFQMLMQLKFVGFFFVLFGVIIFVVRSGQFLPFIDLPRPGRVILFHQRRGKNPNVRLVSGKLTDLEYIKSKNKIFKDTGGGFRIGGHDCRRTHETICFDIPEWLSQYFYNIRKKYGVSKSDEWYQLKDALKKLRPPDPTLGITLEDQLRVIPLLKPIMDDPKRKKVLLDMDVKQLQSMEELLFDGVTHHSEEVEQFIDSATPNELDVFEKQSYVLDTIRGRGYSTPGNFNYAQIMFWAIILMVVLGTVIIITGSM